MSIQTTFERQYGTEILCKVEATALTRLLVKKGLLTKREVLDSFMSEVLRFTAAVSFLQAGGEDNEH